MRFEKWVSAYLWTTFCADMSTTQRSENINQFFKYFVRPNTMVSNFVYQYEKALNTRYLKEKKRRRCQDKKFYAAFRAKV